MSYGHFYLFLSYWENEDIVNAIAHLGNITTTEAGLARAAFHRHDILALLSKELYEEVEEDFKKFLGMSDMLPHKASLCYKIGGFYHDHYQTEQKITKPLPILKRLSKALTNSKR